MTTHRAILVALAAAVAAVSPSFGAATVTTNETGIVYDISPWQKSENHETTAARLGCMRIAPEWGRSGPLSVAKAHAAGLSVNLWCSDSTFIYDTVKAWGSDVSTSNAPRAIVGHARSASPAGRGCAGR